MKAIILAAGRGSRMKEKTNDLPKCLTVLWGKTLLEWQLKALREAGIREIGIVTGYRSDRIKESNVHYFHNENWENTNMFASLLEAKSWLENDDCIISYSDIIYTKNAIKKLIENDFEIVLTYYTKFLELWTKRFENPLEDIESFKFDSNYNLIEIGNKVNDLSEIQGQYMGLLKFSPQGWQKVMRKMQSDTPKPISKIDMTTTLGFLLKHDVDIKVVPYDELWLEVDNQDDLLLYSEWNEAKESIYKGNERCS